MLRINGHNPTAPAWILTLLPALKREPGALFQRAFPRRGGGMGILHAGRVRLIGMQSPALVAAFHHETFGCRTDRSQVNPAVIKEDHGDNSKKGADKVSRAA